MEVAACGMKMLMTVMMVMDHDGNEDCDGNNDGDGDNCNDSKNGNECDEDDAVNDNSDGK